MSTVRVVDPTRMVCPVCDQAIKAVRDRKTGRRVVGVHGPVQNRCTGAYGPGVPWRIACRLPAWDELEDYDKGQVLMFAHKLWWEQSYMYARDNYPPTYRHPFLCRLKVHEGCRYATLIIKEMGEPLPSVKNMWARYSTPFRIYPDMVQEPLIDMARRILGEDECTRLMEGIL